jgi:hypothetical protein
MLTQNTLETLRHLKLHGMAQALEEQRDTPNTHALSFEERLALFVNRRAKWTTDRRPTLTRVGRLFEGSSALDFI